jgi:hypothetical protein
VGGVYNDYNDRAYWRRRIEATSEENEESRKEQRRKRERKRERERERGRGGVGEGDQGKRRIARDESERRTCDESAAL